jgi:Protein of unknown function (DUF3142)
MGPLLLLACIDAPRTPSRAGPLPHEVYLWQREWTDAVDQAVAAAAPAFDGLRVNAASVSAAGVLEHRVHLAALAVAGGAVRIVARVDANVAPQPAVLSALLGRLAAEWRAAGVRVLGVELDHDCATSQLAGWATTVEQVRAALPADLLLSVTALPTWLEAPVPLRALADAADALVLQVHAVDPPASGMFDPERAIRAVRAYAEFAGHLWVALPSYGLRLADGRELRVDPAEVVQVLTALDDVPVEGVVWFRAPVAGDARAWTLEVLNEVRERRIPRGSARVEVHGSPSGAYDLRLVNDGPVWVARPTTIALRGPCTLADGLAGYAIDRAAGLALVGAADTPLDPGRPIAIGWVRCAEVDGTPVPPLVELR